MTYFAMPTSVATLHHCQVSKLRTHESETITLTMLVAGSLKLEANVESTPAWQTLTSSRLLRAIHLIHTTTQLADGQIA